MTEVETRDIPLNWDVFVTAGIPTVTSDLPPGTEQGMWSPASSTLIYGRQDAILVDAFTTVKETKALINWVAASGKNLTTIYVTHGHGDHCFGKGALLDRFPNAKAVAVPAVVRVMREQSSSESLAQFWGPLFPGQIPDRLVVAEELRGNTINLEDQELVIVEVGLSDTDYTTCLNIPSIGLVVARDVAYNDVHQYLGESTSTQKRREWISALDKIESLNPLVVIAGHKRQGRQDSPKIIEKTRQYIRDFDRVDGMTTTSIELYDKMLELYPNRVNPGMLWSSARAVNGAIPYG